FICPRARSPRASIFLYTTLFRSISRRLCVVHQACDAIKHPRLILFIHEMVLLCRWHSWSMGCDLGGPPTCRPWNPSLQGVECQLDRKSTRLNSSHVKNSYAVFCL